MYISPCCSESEEKLDFMMDVYSKHRSSHYVSHVGEKEDKV